MLKHALVFSALLIAITACHKTASTPTDAGNDAAVDAGVIGNDAGNSMNDSAVESDTGAGTDASVDAAMDASSDLDASMTATDASASDASDDAAMSCSASTIHISIDTAAGDDVSCAGLLDGTIHNVGFVNLESNTDIHGVVWTINACPENDASTCPCHVQIHNIGADIVDGLNIRLFESMVSVGMTVAMQANASAISVGNINCTHSPVTCDQPLQIFYAADGTLTGSSALATYEGWSFSEGDVTCGASTGFDCSTVRRNIVLTTPHEGTFIADEGNTGDPAAEIVGLRALRTNNVQCHDPGPSSYAFYAWNAQWNPIIACRRAPPRRAH